MPNWVTTTVHAIKNDVDFNKFAGEDGSFTFERIVPSPGKDYADWYDWNCEHWGTKWDACDPEIENKTTVRFKTAWSFATPVLVELAKKVGGLVCFYADEDIGSNCGAVIIDEDGLIEEIDTDTIFAEVMWGMNIEDRENVLFSLEYYIERE